jgi:hypothetical protein
MPWWPPGFEFLSEKSFIRVDIVKENSFSDSFSVLQLPISIVSLISLLFSTLSLD